MARVGSGAGVGRRPRGQAHAGALLSQVPGRRRSSGRQDRRAGAPRRGRAGRSEPAQRLRKPSRAAALPRAGGRAVRDRHQARQDELHLGVQPRPASRDRGQALGRDLRVPAFHQAQAGVPPGALPPGPRVRAVESAGAGRARVRHGDVDRPGDARRAPQSAGDRLGADLPRVAQELPPRRRRRLDGKRARLLRQRPVPEASHRPHDLLEGGRGRAGARADAAKRRRAARRRARRAPRSRRCGAARGRRGSEPPAVRGGIPRPVPGATRGRTPPRTGAPQAAPPTPVPAEGAVEPPANTPEGAPETAPESAPEPTPTPGPAPDAEPS